jgi:hypothetical protein
MKTIVIKSNHGNHTGFNRKWEVLNSGYPFDSKEEAISYLDNIIIELEQDLEDSEKSNLGLTGYEYDLCYYAVLTEDEYNDDFYPFFDGGHHGYVNEQIESIFN